MNFLQLNLEGLAEAVFFSAGLNYIRYFFMAGLVYYLFFHRPPTWLKPLEISKSKRPLPQNKRDVLYSLLSISIFCVIGILTYFVFCVTVDKKNNQMVFIIKRRMKK